MQKIVLILHLLLLYLPATTQVSNQDADIVMQGNVYLVLSGNFKNNGTFKEKQGTVRFTGNNPIVSGTDTPRFFNLQLYMPATSVLALNTHIEVAKSIQFVSGLLNLNMKNIYLADTALLVNENENSRITGLNGGYVQITALLNKPSNANPGNLGAVLTHSINLDSTIVRRGHQSHPMGTPIPPRSIFRYYQIIPDSGSLSGARLRINYLNAELNTLNPYCLIFFKSVNRASWAFEVPVVRNVSLKYVERTGITNYPFWSLSVYQPPQGGPCLGARQAAESIAAKSLSGNDFIKRIYPTAGVKNGLFVETGNLPLRNMQVILYDAQGNLLLNRQLAYQSQWVTIPAVSAGVYQVKVLSAEHIWLGKFIKE